MPVLREGASETLRANSPDLCNLQHTRSRPRCVVGSSGYVEPIGGELLFLRR